ncbi:MAG: MFS transporter, partial [Alphaproteobacteria bacterium]
MRLPESTPETNALIFAAIAHGAMHFFGAYFFTIILALERVWQMPYPDLIALWTPAALLIGVAALPMGWFADRWSRGGMLALAFVGMGRASILAGFTDGPSTMILALGAVGIFAAIYHPVGIPWVMRLARQNPGKALAINGLFGGSGVALAALTAGALVDFVSWRAAFVLPGLVSVALGGVMFMAISRGRVAEPEGQLELAVAERDHMRVSRDRALADLAEAREEMAQHALKQLDTRAQLQSHVALKAELEEARQETERVRAQASRALTLASRSSGAAEKGGDGSG